MTRLAITTERWCELKELLDELWALAPVDHDAWLDEHCKDPEIRAQAEALLVAAEDAADYLERLASDIGVARDEESAPADLSGRIVGHYRLLEPLGRGGMGVIYLAERADGAFEQCVAVKLLAMGLAGPEGHRRFLAERQILAGLEHPAIARLLDGGVTEDGTPYFVMERVEGERIDLWCDARHLRVRERIELLCRVCEAVEYAHRRLIVHRDLKPANVLITGAAEPKLLDFGVAKLLTEGDSHLTRTCGAVPLTPSWAAPEQLEGGTVTTATDTWALGALAYYLLVGVPPHDIEDRTHDDIRRQLHVGPTAASIRLASLPEAAQARIAGARGSSAGELRRRLSGDLDAILIRALSFEPEHRYGSAGELAAEFERYVQGRPVQARAPSFGYRMGRFARRNRVAVAVTALVAASLLLGTAVALWQAREAATELDHAEEQRLRAEQVTGFLRDLFKASDPVRAQGRDITARELLDQGARQLQFAFAGSPELRAEMMVLLGSLYYDLGEYESARPLLEQGLAAAEDIGELDIVVDALHAVARLDLDTAHYEQALAALEDAEKRLSQAGLVPGGSHAALMPALTSTLIGMGRFREAVERGEAALAAARADMELSPKSLFDYLMGCAEALLRAEQSDRAEELLREAMALELEADDIATRKLSLRLRLAVALERNGELEEALALQRQVLDTVEQLYSPLHAWRAEQLRNTAVILAGLGRYEEVERAARQALEIYEAIDPEGQSHHRAYLHNLLGGANRFAERYEKAEQHYMQARQLAIAHFGRNEPFHALVLSNLGVLLRLSGRHQESEQALAEALDAYRSVLGPDSAMVGRCLAYLAELRLDQGRPGEAVELANDALDLYRRTGYEGPNFSIQALVIRARALDRLGRPEDADADFAAALAVGKAAQKDAGTAWPLLLFAHAEHLLGLGSSEAPAAAERAVQAYRDAYGIEHPATRRVEAFRQRVRADSGLPR